MWRIHRDKHCTDEELLGHLDGEISRRRSAEVERHLRNCWECRARSARLNEQSQALARMFVSPPYLGPDDLVRGKARFRLRRDEVERELAARTSPRMARLQWAALGTAAAVIVFCAVWWLRSVPAPAVAARIDAGAALQRAGRQERQTWTNRAVHQVYSVEMLQELPERRREVRRLEVWEDSRGGRYASTLCDASGRLRFGIWVPDGGAGYEMESGDRAVAVPVRHVEATAGSAADSIASGSGDLEETLKAWLKQRRWQRLAPASDFEAFASEDAVVLAVKQIGAGQLRLTARRLTGDVRLTATLELDRAGHARLHSIRVESAGRAAEFRLREERFEPLEREDLDARVFEPGVPLVPGSGGDGSLAAAGSVRDLAGERLLEAYYALHRAGACLKETLEVRSESGGRVALRLLVADRAREMEVREALARDASADSWDLEIQIGRPKPHARTGPAAAQPGMELARRWDGVWEEGLALVDLAGHFGPEVRAGFTPESRLLLHSMLRDHAAALSALAGSLRASLPAAPPVPAPALEAGAAAGDWRERCFRLFQAVDRVDRLIEDGSARQAGIAEQELPALHASLNEVEFLAGLVMRSGDTPRMSVSGVRYGSDRSSPHPRPGKGAPK